MYFIASPPSTSFPDSHEGFGMLLKWGPRPSGDCQTIMQYILVMITELPFIFHQLVATSDAPRQARIRGGGAGPRNLRSRFSHKGEPL